MGRPTHIFRNTKYFGDNLCKEDNTKEYYRLTKSYLRRCGTPNYIDIDISTQRSVPHIIIKDLGRLSPTNVIHY
nr:MAG TPA: hypothetical protein [Caudoviricetes sp.]